MYLVGDDIFYLCNGSPLKHKFIPVSLCISFIRPLVDQLYCSKSTYADNILSNSSVYFSFMETTVGTIVKTAFFPLPPFSLIRDFRGKQNIRGCFVLESSVSGENGGKLMP